jgi:hypothetical protein
MSDWHPDFDRFEADLNDRDAQTSSPQVFRIYVDATTVWNSDGHSKVLGDLLLVRDWFTENDPEGVAFNYEILD